MHFYCVNYMVTLDKQITVFKINIYLFTLLNFFSHINVKSNFCFEFQRNKIYFITSRHCYALDFKETVECC